ncbi:hypothetical protein KEM60_01493 [Austwickia sp. TVS 96-490-7B]|uniref:FtsX-like permease family protein n=1 Tax=Austwickia sp. TVS 96-490-7B TaxID=2830843 RepID=UPI001C559AE3|nr:FtsX-like permease family protein [Austwickia sp. TVS 96-490-7B]MBW3085296.1 hypothetical protein [Austwickia sp. TVS 96-490-7B]
MNVTKKSSLGVAMMLIMAQVRRSIRVTALAFLGCLVSLLAVGVLARVDQASTLTRSELADRAYGSYVGVIDTREGQPLSESDKAELGPYATLGYVDSLGVRRGGDTVAAAGRIFDAGNPQLAAVTVVKSGSFAAGAESLGLSEALARRIGAGIGDEVQVKDSVFRVSALYVDPQDTTRLGWIAPVAAIPRLTDIPIRYSYLTMKSPSAAFLMSHQATYRVQSDPEISYRIEQHGMDIGRSVALLAAFMTMLVAILLGFNSILLKDQERDYGCLHRVGVSRRVMIISAMSPLILGAIAGLGSAYALTAPVGDLAIRVMADRNHQIWGAGGDLSQEQRAVFGMVLLVVAIASWLQCRRFFVDHVQRRPRQGMRSTASVTIFAVTMICGVACAWWASSDPNGQPLILAGVILIGVGALKLVPWVLYRLPLLARWVRPSMRDRVPVTVEVPIRALVHSGPRNNGIVAAFMTVVAAAVFIHVMSYGLRLGVAFYHVSPLDTNDNVVTTTRPLTVAEKERLGVKATWRRGMVMVDGRQEVARAGSREVLCRALPIGSAQRPAESDCEKTLHSVEDDAVTIADEASASYLVGRELTGQDRQDFVEGRLALTKGEGWAQTVGVGVFTSTFVEKTQIRTKSFPYRQRSSTHPGFVISPAAARSWGWIDVEAQQNYALEARPGWEVFRELPADQELRAFFYQSFRNAAFAPAGVVATWSVWGAAGLTFVVAAFVVMAWKRQDARNRGVLQAVGCSPRRAKAMTSVMFAVVIGWSCVVGMGIGVFVAWCTMRPTVMIFPPLSGAVAITCAPVIAALLVVWMSGNDPVVMKRAQQ